MLRTAIVATVLLAIVLLSPRAAVAAIPEPPPYPWEYLPPGSMVIWIPYLVGEGEPYPQAGQTP
jgi:hypothetical protein